MEFSKLLAICLIAFGIICIIWSFLLAFDGKNPNESVTVALITEVVAVQAGYMWYQYKLKDSRNKHGIDQDGVPYDEYEMLNKYIDNIDEDK